LPTAGLRDHVTVPSEDPSTPAVNCCHWDPVSDTVAGESKTETDGDRVTLALAYLAGSATLVATTVTTCAPVMDAGAV